MWIRVTLILFILICFEVGALLFVLPWTNYWRNNYLLVLAVDWFGYPWLYSFAMNGYVRGAVSGLGILNLLLMVYEIANFRKSVKRYDSESLDSKSPETVAIPDNGPDGSCREDGQE